MSITKKGFKNKHEIVTEIFLTKNKKVILKGIDKKNFSKVN